MVVSQPTYVVHQPSAAAHLGFNTTFVQCPGCHNQVRNHVVHSQGHLERYEGIQLDCTSRIYAINVIRWCSKNGISRLL